MPSNPLDVNYGTQAQVEYAREMAKFLRAKKGFQMTPGMAVLPGSWAHSLPDVVDAISQGRYQDIAGQQDRNITDRKLDPNAAMPSAPSTVGGNLTDFIKSKSKGWFGGGTNKSIIQPGTEPKELTTGSLPEGETTPTAQYPDAQDKIYYADLVKERENPDLFKGKTDRSRAQWDFKQHTNGYGTKAKHEAETINKDEADLRFNNDWIKAQNQVDQFKPGLPQGPRGALTSLTFNSGTKWMESGLGAAVQADDHEKAKELFTQYNGVIDPKTGQKTVLAGLDKRRKDEVKWFDDVTPNTGGLPQAPKSDLPVKTGQLEGSETNQQLIGGSSGDQLQQVAQAYGTQPVQNPAPNAPVQSVGAFEGTLPPRNPVSTDEQLKYQMRGASPDKQQEIIEQHKKDIEGRAYDIQGGGKVRIPGDPKGQVTSMPGPDIPFGPPELNLRMRQYHDGFGIITPKGEEKRFGNMDSAWRYVQDMHAQGGAVKNVMEGHSNNINEAIKAGPASAKAEQTLSVMNSISKSNPLMSQGPTSDYIVKAKQFLENFYPGIAKSSDEEVMQKLTSFLAAESEKAVYNNRGTNFGLQTFTTANPNLMQSKDGREMMIDILQQEMKQRQDISKLAPKYVRSGPEAWQARLDEYYDTHPIIIKRPLGDGKFQNITTQKINSKEERDALPPGTNYIRPDGSIGTRP